MGFAEFKPVVKKVNLKPKGEVEIVLISSLGALRGNIETLSEMIDQKVQVALDSTVVTYNVQINARTEKPIKSYRVDDQGVVHELKPEGEQLEMDLGLPKDKQQIQEVQEEVERKIVDEFILSLLAPTYDDMPYPFYAWVSRMVEDGDTYSKIAGELGWSSGKVAELLDEYRARIAPLAAKWDEWRQSKAEQPAPAEVSGDEAEDEQAGSENDAAESANESAESDDDLPPATEETQQDVAQADDEDTLSEWEREIMAGNDPQIVRKERDPAEIEEIILAEKPLFEDIPFDFPALLARRKSGETWIEIANSLGTRSTILSAAWSKYKKRVADQRGGAA